MKIIVDTSTINQLAQTYGDRADKVLWTGIDGMRAELSIPGLDYSNAELFISYDDIVRHQKISQRKSVAIMENARDCLSHLNLVTGKSFRPVDTNLKPIASLLKTYNKEVILRVIDNKVAKWKGTSMDDYLRPSTLFRASNFEAYANESLAPEVQEKNFGAELDSILGAK